MEIKVAGENSLICYFDSDDLRISNQQVMTFCQQLTRRSPHWLVDVTPAYQSLLVIFDPLLTDHLAVKSALRRIMIPEPQEQKASGKRIDIPVFYNHPVENDLARMAELHKMPVEAIIDLHERQVYQVFAIGFSPGFAFLGEVDSRIATPRLATPRTRVPKGAVGIADRQTAVYPNESPGGWNIIGVSPFTFFDPESRSPIQLQVGDEVKFKSISKQAFQQLGGEI